MSDEERVDREIDAIAGRYIYCPTFNEMNDPMEGTHSASALFRGEKNYDTTVAELNKAKSTLGIASLSEVYDHEPMWAHYADQFHGMCVAYSLSKLLGELSSKVALVRMNYSEKAPVLLRGRKTPEDRARLALSTKTIRWMSEREWRIIAPKSGRAQYKTADCVTRVYLGSRMAAEDQIKVRRKMAKLGIDVCKMHIEEYEIAFRKLRTYSK